VIPTVGRPPTTVAGWRKRHVDATLEECEAVGRCECGQPLETHDPLPAVPPLRSEQAKRTSMDERRRAMNDRQRSWNRWLAGLTDGR